MAQQNGRELVIKRSATADGTGTKVFVCGMRTRSWTINNATIDTTVPNCDARLQRIVPYEVVVPGFGTYVGPMGVYDFEFSADMEEPLGFSATWRPADASALVYTPETP
jgi:predicted secreted protein